MDVAQTIQRSWLKLLKITDIPLPTGPKVLAIGTRTLLKVTNAVPAAAEYEVLIGLVETSGPRGINMTVKPILFDHQNKTNRGSIKKTCIRFAASGEVISEGTVCDPPVVMCEYDGWSTSGIFVLLSSGDYPTVTVSNCCGLQTADITSSKGFTDGKCKIFLPRKSLGQEKESTFRT
jgi:hypothetical protein